jgi:AraC-like DNA-binding protein
MHKKDYTIWPDSLADGGQLWRLFEDMPDVLFFVKDLAAYNRYCNQAMLRHLGLQSKDQLVGKCDADFLPHYMVEKYRIDDAEIIKTGTPLLHIIELFPAQNGLPQLFITNKYPVYDHQHNICGICGIIRKLNDDSHLLTPYSDLTPAIHFIRENFPEKITVHQLAAESKLSIRQFQRRFKDVFRTTPMEYVMKYRLLRAADQLANSGESITLIAQNNGFYDHSTFVKHFKKHMNQTPRKYRISFNQ